MEVSKRKRDEGSQKDKGKVTKAKPNPTVQCCSCNAQLPENHLGIQCSNGHHICPRDCCQAFIKSALSSGVCCPPRCPMKNDCEVNVTSFERQLGKNEMITYLSYCAKRELRTGDRLAECPTCNYFEVWSPAAAPGRIFFQCRNNTCKESDNWSCLVCKRIFSLSPPTCGNNTQNRDEFVRHVTVCEKLQYDKRNFDRAIENGSGTKCPKCGIVGRKDDNCTHVYCAACDIAFCYVCGLSEHDCDKAPSLQGLSAHNINWKTNTRRCPFVLLEIHDVDKRWPAKDDKECVEYFAKQKTLSLLNKLYENTDYKEFEQLVTDFDSVRNAGFSLEEIRNFQGPLIRRQGTIQLQQSN